MTGHRSARRLVARLGVALLSALLVAGCADTETQDLCAQYDGLVSAAEKLREEDPATAQVEDLRAAADDVRDELDQFQAVSEGRLDDALTRLRDNIDAVRQAALNAGEEARQTAEPMVEDALDRVEESWQIVQDIAEAQCPAQA